MDSLMARLKSVCAENGMPELMGESTDAHLSEGRKILDELARRRRVGE